ncbi:methyltransferase domain-containing protein [Paenibacillus sp.]|uniref:methyltransferase domain-containing protein n=1 Tax=Paenibacillus sp. TaxID=58172 RepID=UPI002D39A7FB|nr:methyltransferase domain-containing protein [Paenibacillus sp.]HZG56831.1 methyltransferase domain-containing protein [Paenibacillus sp.]
MSEKMNEAWNEDLRGAQNGAQATERAPGFYPQAGVAVTCRSYREYEAMFALDDEALRRGPVLDVAGGASSFAAEAGGRGAEVVAADPRYAKDADTLYAESAEEIAASTAKLARLKERFDWSYYGSLEAHRANREASLEAFAADYRREREREREIGAGERRRRYVAAALPRLPFPDDAFALTLCSHFLFLYEEQFDFAFHRDALRELYRVTRPGGEVRVYPLYTLRHERYPGLEALIESFEAAGAAAALLPSSLPFIPGSTRLLRIAKPAE